MSRLRCPLCKKALAVVKQGERGNCSTAGCTYRVTWAQARLDDMAWRATRV
jgi:hypothetical protein